MKIKPLGERVLIKTEKNKEEKTKSGIYLPKSEEDKKQGIIEGVGVSKDGKGLPINKGDKVYIRVIVMRKLKLIRRNTL